MGKVDTGPEILVENLHGDDALGLVLLAIDVCAIAVFDDELAFANAFAEDGLNARLGCGKRVSECGRRSGER